MQPPDSAHAGPPGPFDGDPVPAGHFDEVRTPDGAARPAWQRFTEAAGHLGPDTLSYASARIARQMHEHGVTYNVYEAPDDGTRPWALDALPMLVAADEWDNLDAGLRQQARLMNAIATDLYGDRRLVAEGRVPPTLVFGHRGFLRPCVGARPRGGVFVHVAAFDLARGPDGRWYLMGVRVQAPSGLGYTLENRAALTRVFGEPVRRMRVRPLGPFIDALLRMLTSLAPVAAGEEPRAVMLTPGPYSETFFEHLYLARQLGITLVQGGDLTVRQDRVYLKTVSGLRPVHAVWRRVDDGFCDPLELRSDSTLGVAGLVQAWRAGNVLVANGFGLGVLESPALLPYLSTLARRLLGSPLALPVVPTWWQRPSDGGGPGLARGVIKPALAGAGTGPVFGRLLDAEARSSWMNRLEANPAAYAVQDFVPLSHAPVWQDGRLATRPLVMRVFLVADGRGDYQVMPGALSRVATSNELSVSAQRGGASKDTWILSDGPVDEQARVHARQALVPIHPGRETVTSRAAEHLFWLGRYAERSEDAARLTRTIVTRLTEGGMVPAPLIATMLHACGEEGLLTEDELTGAFADPQGVAPSALVSALVAGVFDRTTRGGLSFNVAHTTRVAGSVRERLSYDNWRVLAKLADRLAPRAQPGSALDNALEAVDDAILSLVAAGGLEMAHMTRDDGWRFLSLGRHLERLSFVSTTLLGVTGGRATDEPAVLDWILDLSDSLITYRARYRRMPDWATVLDLLVLDGRNPRSLLFQVGKLNKHLRLLPGDALEDLVRQLDALEAAGRPATDGDAGPDAAEATATEAERLVVACRDIGEQVSEALTLQYFSHVYDTPHATVNA